MAGRRVLLIAGAPPREPAVADALRERARPGVVTVWELPDTPHTAALARHGAAWEARVIGFLDEALR
jgi:hypothetical protein